MTAYDGPAVDRQDWVAAATAARDEGAVQFDVLTAVDLEADGFEVVLHLWDPEQRRHRLLRTRCPREDATVPSLTALFQGAGWHERSVAEMFGIAFSGHDTAPLQLPGGFDGHPLRKEFGLTERGGRWPGAKEPGESDSDLAAPSTRRRAQPLGRPPGWAP